MSLSHKNGDTPTPFGWYAWEDSAFARADELDRPIFLYLTVPWSTPVHLFERDILGDLQVSQLLNESYVPIRVDALRRPDVYERYNQGGWPSFCLLTPEGDLLHGRSANTVSRVLDTLGQVATYWADHKEKIRERVRQVGPPSLPRYRHPEPGEMTDPAPLDGIRLDAIAYYDVRYHGFGRAPKFPMADLNLFLLTDREVEYQRLALATLEALRASPVHDVLGGGFHRFAELETWGQPRFEKLLSTNVSLLEAYVEAFRGTGDERWFHVASGILGFLEGSLQSEDGLYCTALDSDAEPGEPGSYYGWSRDEIRKALGDDEMLNAAAITFFGVSRHSRINGDSNRSYLEERVTPAQISMRLGCDEERVQRLLSSARDRLRAAREDRQAPPVDRTINSGDLGRMIGALATAAMVLNRPWALQRGFQIADKLWRDSRRSGGGMEHVIGESGDTVYLSDLSELILGYLELYRVAGRGADLVRAVTLARESVELLGDEEGVGFFDHRERELEYGAVRYPYTPFEGNSRLLHALALLSAYTRSETWHSKALNLSAALAQARLRHRLADAAYGLALRALVRPPLLVDLIGTASAGLRRRILMEAPPGTLIRSFNPEQKTPWTPPEKYPGSTENLAQAVIYSNGTVSKPLTDTEVIIQVLQA